MFLRAGYPALYFFLIGGIKMYLCFSCFEVYDDEFINSNRNICPKRRCSGKIRQIDELMIPTIIELNKKGYVTEFCCSGHLYTRTVDPYISFAREYLFSSLPEHWYQNRIPLDPKFKKFKVRLGGKIINKNTMNNFELYNLILEVNKSIYKWALDLPEYDREVEKNNEHNKRFSFNFIRRP